MRTQIPRKARGFSLIELMIALVAGLIVIGSALVFTVSTVRSYNENIRSTRLTQDLRTAMNLAVREIRRSGFDMTAVSRVLTDNNPAPSFSVVAVPATNDCVAYQYDRGDALENRALRLNSATGTLQAKVSAAAVSCSDTTGWVDVSDPAVVNATKFVVKIRKYPFCRGLSSKPDPANPATKVLWDVATGSVSNLSLCLKGSLRADSSLSRTVFDTTRPRAESVVFTHDVVKDAVGPGSSPCPADTADSMDSPYNALTSDCSL